MWETTSLVVHILILCQGLASGWTTRSYSTSTQNDYIELDTTTIPNIVLEPDQASVLATLERLQKENAELRQQMHQSHDDIMAVVRKLQEDNVQLKTMRDDMKDLVTEMISNMGRGIEEHMREMHGQVNSQMADLVMSVEQMKGQQEALMEQGEVMQGVMEVVQEFQDEADNVTSRLDQLQGRMMALEASVRTLREEGSDNAGRLSDVQHRMDNLESLLRNLQGSTPPSTPSPSTTPPSTTTPTTTVIEERSSSSPPRTPTTIPETPGGYTDEPWTLRPESSSSSSLSTSERPWTPRPWTSPPTSPPSTSERPWTWRPETSPSSSPPSISEGPRTWRPETSPSSSPPSTSGRPWTFLPETSPSSPSLSTPSEGEESSTPREVKVTSGDQTMCVHTAQPTPSGNRNSQSIPVSNVALHKPALQSTYHPTYGHPDRAVDGSQASDISQCTHTADVDSNPNRWWRVDLMGMFEVEAVVITNRGDCCGQRLTDFNVYVMKTLEDPSEREHDVADLCLHHDDQIPDGATVRLNCDQPMVGQYVSLVLNTRSWPLHFCEIQVLGRPAPGYTTPFPIY